MTTTRTDINSAAHVTYRDATIERAYRLRHEYTTLAEDDHGDGLLDDEIAAIEREYDALLAFDPTLPPLLEDRG